MSRGREMLEMLTSFILGVGLGLVIVVIARDPPSADRQERVVGRFLARPISLEVRGLSTGEVLDALCEAEGCRWHKDRGRIVIEPIEGVRP